jgi:outer membrane protein OmpA-like peptidoglycan-associated protein
MIGFFAACAAPPRDEPIEFRVAMIRLSGELMGQFRGSQSILKQVTDKVTDTSRTNRFIVDPFVDGDTGDVTQTSETIVSIFTDAVQSPPNNYSVLPISNENLRQAGFVVVGTIRFENYAGLSRKLYRVHASVVDIASGDILANAAVWVANRKLDDAPVSIYKDSPMFLKDNVVQKQLDAAETPAGPGRATSYVRSLGSGTTTNDGASALGRQDYDTAINLFTRSIGQTDGRTMKNYAGLYEAYYRSHQLNAAAQAFSDLFALGAQNNNITVRFLFTVNSTAFFNNTDITAQYDLWLRRISLYLDATGQCMSVVGHSSHTGTAEYNLALSLRRAQRIREILVSHAPRIGQRLNAIGRGFEENIIGSGTDDDQDAIDRRVEFRQRDCQTG